MAIDVSQCLKSAEMLKAAYDEFLKEIAKVNKEKASKIKENYDFQEALAFNFAGLIVANGNVSTKQEEFLTQYVSSISENKDASDYINLYFNKEGEDYRNYYRKYGHEFAEGNFWFVTIEVERERGESGFYDSILEPYVKLLRAILDGDKISDKEGKFIVTFQTSYHENLLKHLNSLVDDLVEHFEDADGGDLWFSDWGKEVVVGSDFTFVIPDQYHAIRDIDGKEIIACAKDCGEEYILSPVVVQLGRQALPREVSPEEFTSVLTATMERTAKMFGGESTSVDSIKINEVPAVVSRIDNIVHVSIYHIDEYYQLRITFKGEFSKQNEIAQKIFNSFSITRHRPTDRTKESVIDEGGVSSLHLVCKNGEIADCRLLLEQGADINAQDEDGLTPLHLAAGLGRLDIVKFLLERGADIEAKEKYGCTPLHYAGERAIAKCIIEHGADIEVKTKSVFGGATPLHLVAASGALGVVKLLLEQGADINAKDEDGLTPLQIANRMDELDVAKLLMEYGADIEDNSDIIIE